MEKSHTKRWQRVAVFVIALLFIATSASLTIAVLLQGSGSSNSNNNSSDTSKKLTPQQEADIQKALTKENAKKAPSQPTKLQGTELQGFTPIGSVNSLQTTNLKVGSGPAVKAGQTVTVNYTGAVAATGKIFQSSLDTGQPATFSLSQVIKGWGEGIPGMQVGGERQLLIPASLAYGSSPPPGSGIPPNAALVFNVTLLKIGS